MIRYTLLSACLVLTYFSVCKVSYAESIQSSDAVAIQSEEYQNFEDWYAPDEAYETDDGGRSDKDIIPKGGDSQPRTAPDEDTRPKER